jgi:hypothetical protein
MSSGGSGGTLHRRHAAGTDMQSLAQLDSDALKLARQSADTLMKFKAYLPPGGFLVMLLGKFRDDVLEMLEVERDQLPKRGAERHPLDELTSVELDSVFGAVGILVGRFTAYMDDPALPDLLGQFRDALNEQKAERARELAALDAKAS